MSNETALEDQTKDCPIPFNICCLEFISDHGYKKLCEDTTFKITFGCIFMTVLVITLIISLYIIPKIIEYYDPGAEAAFFQEIAELVQLAELEQLESALEAKPDPLSDLSENLNKINICHEIREIPFPKDVQIPSRNRSVIVNV